jgi:uronate dehydrogenase
MLNPKASPLVFSKLLLTGAAGQLGRELRPRLKAYCDVLRVSDQNDLGVAAVGEEIQTADLANASGMQTLLKDVNAVVHLGGVSTEQAWAPILASNIVGMVNLYEAARLQGTKRIVFASSNHVTGFYRQDEVVNTKMPTKPDGFYGLSKAFGEDLAELYWARWGIETVSLRIGSSYAEPKDRRMLATWLSFDDLERLVVSALTAPIVGHTIIFGMSDNQTSWWDNTHAKHIGYRALDSSDVFRHEVEARQPHIDRHDKAALFQGGAFVKMAPHGDSATPPTQP